MKHKNFKENFNISENYSKKLISGKVTATAGIKNPHNLSMVYGAGANRIEVLRALEKQSKFQIIWYAIFIVLALSCLIIEPKSYLYAIDLVILLFNLDLAAKGKLVGIYIGIIECILYSYICFISGLYGEVIKMFVINIPLNIFTIISWSRNLKQQKEVSYKKEENNIIIRKLNTKTWWWIALIIVVIYTCCFFGLKVLNTSALVFSAGALTCTIFSKVLNGLRYKEGWIFNITLNIISIFMWLQVIIFGEGSGINLIELPALFAGFACLTNSINGYNLWKSMYRKIAVNGGEILAIRKVKVNKIIKLRRRYQKLVWNKQIDISKNS